MRYLLDTHVLLWSLLDIGKLSKKARDILESKKNEILVSSLSLWEISLKVSLGKMDFENLEVEDLPDSMGKMGFGIITLEPGEAANYKYLPSRTDHKDPFDRMLIWQAITRNLILISKDKKVREYKEYGLKALW